MVWNWVFLSTGVFWSGQVLLLVLYWTRSVDVSLAWALSPLIGSAALTVGAAVIGGLILAVVRPHELRMLASPAK